MQVQYTIGTVSKLTGLSPHTIRAWERRYVMPSPNRTGTNHRLYSDEDVQRLTLLNNLVRKGHSIGQIAQLSIEQLSAMAKTSGIELRERHAPSKTNAHLVFCRAAIEEMDYESLELSLSQAGLELGVDELLEHLISPLLSEIGIGWREGKVNISQEHLASAAISAFLSKLRASIMNPPTSPRILITTLREHHHEIGALMAAIVAGTQNWNVTYMGTNMPSSEIANAARMCKADAVGISLVYSHNNTTAESDLEELRSKLGPKIPILIGGSAGANFPETIRNINAIFCPDLQSLRTNLSELSH